MAKKAIEFTEKEKEIIAKKCFPKSASKEDIEYGILLAETLGLNPLTKEIMFMERRSQVAPGQWVTKIEPLVGRDGFLSIAHKTGQFDGIETTVELVDTPILEDGEWKVKKDLVATCKVYRKDTNHPVTVQVSFEEYAQRDKKGNLTSFWRTKPKTMLGKVAESQALRKAFNISGAYAPEELDDNEGEFSTQTGVSTEEKTETTQHPDTNVDTTVDVPAEKVTVEKNESVQSEDTLDKKTLSKLQDLLAELKNLGLTLNEDRTVSGKTYGKSKQLIALGFKWDPDAKKWRYDYYE